MAERVDLHVGVPRAASFYLQKLLHDNRSAVEAAGVDLLVETARDLGRAAQDIASGGGQYWRDLAVAVQASPNRVLLSWDVFSTVGRTGAQLAVADLAPAEVRVICAVRDPVRLIPAVWQQQVRTGSTEGFDDFVAGVRAGKHADVLPDPVQVVDAWAGALPVEHVSVVVVPASPKDKLWPLFAAAADLDPSILDEPGQDLNLPDAPALELLRHVNAALGEELPSQHKRYRDLLRPMATRTRHETVEVPLTLADDDLAWATEEGRRIATGLRERGVAVHGDLEHLVSGPDEVPAHRPVDQAAVTTLAADTIAGLLLALRQARRRIPEENTRAGRLARARVDGGAEGEVAATDEAAVG